MRSPAGRWLARYGTLPAFARDPASDAFAYAQLVQTGLDLRLSGHFDVRLPEDETEQLLSEAEQAAAGLRADGVPRDGTWLFSDWAERALPDKTTWMAALITEAVAGTDVAGVVPVAARVSIQHRWTRSARPQAVSSASGDASIRCAPARQSSCHSQAPG